LKGILFQASKLNYATTLARPALQIRCAVRLSFSITNWYHEDWRATMYQPPASPDEYLDWGPKTDPLESLQLGALWPDFTEDQLNENSSFTDLDAYDAPAWLVSYVAILLCDAFYLFYLYFSRRALRPRVSHPMSNGQDLIVTVIATALEATIDTMPSSPVAGTFEDAMLSTSLPNNNTHYNDDEDEDGNVAKLFNKNHFI